MKRFIKVYFMAVAKEYGKILEIRDRAVRF